MILLKNRIQQIAPLVLMIGLLLSANAKAQQETRELRKQLETRHGLVSLSTRQTLNENGSIEVIYEHEEIRQGLPNTRLDILWGRDLNSDTYPDAWFYVDRDGIMRSIDQTAKRRDGWDVARSILLRKMDLENRAFESVAFNAVATTLLFTASSREDHLREISRTQMNLLELEIRADRLEKKNPGDPQIQLMRNLVSGGWHELSNSIQSQQRRSELLWALADLGMIVTGTGIGKGAIKLFQGAGSHLSSKEATAWAEKAYEGYSTGVKQAAESAGKRVGTKIAMTVAARSFPELAKQAIRASVGRDALMNIAGKSMNGVALVSKAAASQWKYVLTVQGIQLAAEMMVRGDALFNPNPIVMAKNIGSDKDLLQNLAYMTTETLFLSTATSMVSSTKKAMAICAVISMVNSTVMNLVIKGSDDGQRVAFDTAWEVAIGNTQTQIDMAALKTFQTMATSTGNPHLNTVGWAIVLVDQFAGFAGYSVASQNLPWIADQAEYWSERMKTAAHSVRVELVPILAKQ